MKLFIHIILLFYSTLELKSQNAEEMLNNMFESIKKCNTLTFTVKSWERIDGEMIFTEVMVKQMNKPFKFYSKVLSEKNNGAEVLFISGVNDNKALVNPDIFYAPNINLDPRGSMMSEDQHHTLLQSGFNFFSNIINDAMTRAGENFSDVFELVGEEILNGTPCYKITINETEFSYHDYSVQKFDDLRTVAKNFVVSEFMIMEKNNLNGYGNVKEGDVISIPSSYGKTIALLIDKVNYLPVGQYVYDDEGLFEKYEFSKVVINPVLHDNTFSIENEEYGF